RARGARGRNDEDAGAACLHPLHAFVPAADHHAAAELELERIIAVLARVELGALRAVFIEPAGVVDGHGAARFGALAAADDDVVVLEPGGGGLHGKSLGDVAGIARELRRIANHAREHAILPSSHGGAPAPT